MIVGECVRRKLTEASDRCVVEYLDSASGDKLQSPWKPLGTI